MIELVNGKKHMIVKRDGRIEKFSKQKLNKVLDWAITHMTGVTDPTYIRDDIYKNLDLRIFDKISIVKLYDELIELVANMVTPIFSIGDTIARNLYLLKLYKELFSIKKIGNYPNYIDVIDKGLKYKVYNKDIIETFTIDEINELNSYIKPERDYLFTFAGLSVFIDKYSAKYSKTKHLELPQHAFMRVAIQLHYNDDNRLERIKEKYDILSKHQIAVATPFYLNSLKKMFNPISCVLINIDDDSESILEGARSMGILSKYGSGLGVDVSSIRSIGSTIGIDGKSSGEIPFIKIYESVVKGFNQRGVRPGSVAIYFPWWHYESLELVMLRDAGGSDDNRARTNKYAIKIDEFLLLKVIKNEDVFLFDPKDAPELLDSEFDDFIRYYEMYSKKSGIRKRKINSRELFFSISKVYIETGHLYQYFVDNANKFRAGRSYVNQSNLCGEVILGVKPVNLIKTELINGIEKREYSGEIGVCNLTSINCISFWNMSESEKYNLCYSVAKGIDNSIDYADYPVSAAENFNKNHRAIGIGITNYQQWLASLGYYMDSNEAREVTHWLMEDLNYFIMKSSIELAKERSRYNEFEGSLWSKGKFSWELYQEHFKLIESELGVKLNYEMRRDWSELRSEMKKYGVRFEYHMSVPPGASSSLVLNLTEGIEPLQDILVEREGTFNVKKLAPNISKYKKYYKSVFDFDYKKLLVLAAIRQKFIDQGQSMNLYIKNPDSSYQLFDYINLANKLGLKSLYYSKTNKKGNSEEICEGCAV